MALLSKEQILAADDVKVVKVAVPEWGGEVCVRGMKGWQRDQLDQWAADGKDLTHYRARVVAQALCDEKGAPLGFTEDDITALSDKCAGPLNRVFDIARSLSGIGATDVEDVEKNSPGRSDGSGAS